jgi:hypothetical protein
MCCELGGRAVVVAQYVSSIMLNDAEHQSPQHMHSNIMGKEPAVFRRPEYIIKVSDLQWL